MDFLGISRNLFPALFSEKAPIHDTIFDFRTYLRLEIWQTNAVEKSLSLCGQYENIRALAKKQLQAVTESSDRWKAFLRTAAIAYNYSFPNQLLIHEQSPTATAVADIAYWNNNAGRWVKRGAHGIAVFDTRANSSRLRYLFDISDTIPRAEVPDALPWVITDQNWRPVWDKIVADNHADSIQSALLMLSTSCVAQRSAMFTTALGKAIDGSSLQWAKPDEQRQLFIQLITQSCLYMAALRCGVDTARLDLSALESVNQFDTNRITLCLGSACQQAARPLMQQIGSITREIDSVARAEKVRYYGDKQEETNNTKEVNNGVHDGERLPNPGADAERAADAGDRQVRQPAAEIPARERADGVRRDAAGGNALPASGGDGQRSTPANRADDADADAAEHRPEPADRPDGLDAVDERLAEPSRGTGDAADLQPVIQEPQAESDTTPSAFSVPISDLPPLSDELILGLLAKESSSRTDNAAILEYFNEHPDLAERSAFCKHCYKQIYTYLFVDDHTVGFIRHDMYLELWEGNYLTKTAQVNLTWDAVAAKIADLIEQGRLMVPIKATPVPQQMEQLTLTPEDSEKAGLPSHEQQAKNIDLAAEAKKWNKPIIDASGKYITEQDITDALCKGGGFEDSKFRIQQYLSAQVLPIEEDQARWLKKEYGIGGGTWIFRDGGHGFLDHMGKNLEITRRTEDGEYRRVLKWKEVAQRLRLLVYNDQYLTDAEKAPYQAWAAEQQAARAANDAALDHAKHSIADFCENEGLNEPNFSDLTRVEFAYSTTEDDEHEIQVYANLLRNEIRYEVDGNIVHIDYFHDNHELAAQGIENSAFSDFINTAEAEFEKHHPTTRKVEKSPVTIGSTVYLEDARPFTVEEIGRENIHLRDESFPLVGRAVSHEEFARLLAANPKNAALSAPEVPSRQEQPEETAEPIVGEVIEEPSPFVAQVMADAERLSAEDEPYHREPITYEAPYLDNLPTAPREKFAANIAAICVGKIFEIWEHTMPQRSAQLVFCDLSTPKAGVFNVYDDMKAKLIERGIPETEIAFIHEANTDARKTELFGKVRSGAVRVLMGSTAKMGAGTNVQQRLVALHHLDVPWRPSDIEQREGRILRQGNENKEVYVFRYVTEGTFDAYSWQLIENKQKFIGQIMTSKSPARSCNDMDEAALSYAEVKALAAGNPLIKEKMDLDVQLTRLKTLKAAHDSQRYELENKIAIGFPAEIRKCKEQIENATVDAATVKEHSAVDADGKDVFCIQLEKKVYYEKEPAGKALLGLLGLALNSEKPVPIGYFKGMELQIQHLPFGNEYHARLAGSGTYSTQLGADVLGNLTRLSNLANGIEPSIEKTRNMQIQLEQQLASAEEEVKRPFPQATELTEKSKRLAVLEGLLNMNDKDIVTDTEPEQQCQTDNRQRGQEER